MKKTISFITIVFGIMLLITSCSKEEITLTFDDTEFETTDWTDETHSKSADPNFNEVFSNNSVKRLDFIITEDRWQSMLDDMENNYGSLGSGATQGLADIEDNPIYVPGDVYYNGKQWYKVGLRFKGNSSLQTSWGSGIQKLSFKLDFDEFEDEYPQIDNQRFYGFKKLSLKNNFNDNSFMREKVATDVFRNAGMVASHTAYYTLYVDHGEGPEYFGLYTLVEEVDDTVIDTQFDSNDGNLYKPDGDGASFAEGSFDEDDFEKKTNEDESDWSDIKALFSILHDDSRTTDPVSWRRDLEKVFDTDVFLQYLAINTTIQNWDTYGRMTHNYFLYNNPETNLLTWIPWDNNESLQTGKQGGSHQLDFSGLSSSQWPLIGYLYADSEYRAIYETYLQEVINGPFEINAIQSTYDTHSTLIVTYATSERSGYTFLSSTSNFYNAIESLKSHVASRKAAVISYF